MDSLGQVQIEMFVGWLEQGGEIRVLRKGRSQTGQLEEALFVDQTLIHLLACKRHSRVFERDKISGFSQHDAPYETSVAILMFSLGTAFV